MKTMFFFYLYKKNLFPEIGKKLKQLWPASGNNIKLEIFKTRKVERDVDYFKHGKLTIFN